MQRIQVPYVLKAFSSKSTTIFGLGLLALLVPAAQAQGPLHYFQNYFVTGDYVVGGVGGLSTQGANPTNVSLPFNSVPCTTGPGLFAKVVPCTTKGAVPADIVAAFLYWETIEPTSVTTPGAIAGTFDANLTSGPNINPNATVPMSGLAVGSSAVPACIAGGKESTTSDVRVYRADVLRYLAINSNANVRTANYTHTISFTGNPAATQFLGATLVVVYRLVTPGTPRIAPLRAVVIYDGAFTGIASKSPSLNLTMGGLGETSAFSSPKMTQVVGGGQKGYAETLTVNGSIPPGVSNPFVGAQGAGWDNYTFNYNLPPGAASVQTEVQSSNDCLSWAAIITSANVQDSDFDGLLDVWETSGLYFNPGVRNDGVADQTTTTPATFGTCPAPAGSATPCVNFPAMGAKPNIPDIFVQIDWMEGTYGTSHVHNPQLAALNMVGAAFQSHGINIHFDVGANGPASSCQTVTAAGTPVIGPCAYSGSYIIPAAYAQGGNLVQESSILCEPNPSANPPVTCSFPLQSGEYSVLGWKTGFEAIKDGDPSIPVPGSANGLPQLFPLNRKDTFHYALFGHALAATTPLSTPEAGSISGVGDLPGGDFMVTLGLWRSDVSAVDQVGTMLDQAGTLMHELGHNLDLHHGGWNNTPVCMPNYPSVMNYLYQVAGLTDSSGIEHLDYSYGLELPMSENFLSSAIPMGIQLYKVRYFGPYNGNIDTPGQASAVSCTGETANTVPSIPSTEGKYVLLQGPTVSTPDWSNGTVAPGKLITSGLDINYDGTIGGIFTDSPDWLSLNLQQVSSRAGADGISADLGRGDLGRGDLGRGDLGRGDLGRGDLGTAALGQDALGDQNFAAVVLSGSLGPPTNLTVAVTPTSSSTGATGNLLNWTGNAGVAALYNVYRCNNSTGTTCTYILLASVASGSPVLTTYTDSVNDYVHAGSTCQNIATVTCYDTTYNYYVTEADEVNMTQGPESAASNTVSSDVTHITVIANSQTLTYGAANPTPTYTVYSNVAAATSLTGVTCASTTPPPANANGYYDAGNYPITCTGPTVVAGTSEGITYYALASPSLLYPTSLGGTVAGITQGSLTINPLPITVTAIYSTKVYNATVAAGTISSSSLTTAIPTITTNSLVPGDTPAFTESYDNPNVNPNPGSTHVMTPAGSVNDNNGGKNYQVTFVPSAATSQITPAPLTITATANTKTYNATTSAAAIPTTSVPCGASTVTGPPNLCGSDTITSLTEAYSSPNAGNSVPVTVSPSYLISDGNGGKNYAVTTNGTTGIINPAPVTTTAGSYSGVYNGLAQSPSLCTVTPTAPPPSTFVGTVTCINNPALVGPNASTGTVLPVVSVGANDSLSNYTITPVSGLWNIMKASAIITVNPYNVTYNGNPQTATGTATGVETPPANLSSELNLSGTTHTNAGTYSTDPWTFTDTTGNYNNASGTVSDTINQATPIVTDNGPAPATPDYGQPVTLTVTVAPPGSGEVPTGTVTFSFTLNTVTNYICSSGNISTTQCTVPLSLSNGSYIASVTTSNLPTAAENVMATYSGDPNFVGEPANNLSVTVSQASSGVTLTKSTDPSTYGQSVNLTVKVVDATGDSIGVPTGTVTLSFVLDPTVQNGQVYYICGDGSVITTPCASPNQITLATDPNNSMGAIATVTTTALPAGLATFAGANPPVPFSYPINATYSGDTNFAPSSPFGLSQTVNPLPVTATAGSYSGTYNGAAQSPSACVVTPIAPSTSTGTLTCTNNITSVGPNVGSGTVTPVPAVGAGDSLNNYAITLVNGSWNINQAQVTVNLLNMTQTYTGGPLTPTVSTTPSGIATSLTVGSDVNAGGYPVSAAVTNPNYSGSASGVFVINQYPLTVTATGVNKNFDGTTNATVTLSDNRIPGDNSISDSYTSAAFANIGPGTGISVNVTGISISGGGMGNYSLQNITATTTANISDIITLSALSLNGKNYASNTAALPIILNGGTLQLTNSGSETASAWLGTAIPVSSAFTTTFRFQITPAATGPNAIGDGFAFVIQGAPTGAATLGATGYGMYIGYDGIPNSIAIEFDTYENSQYGDPAGAHVAIQSLGALPNSPDHTSSAKLAGPVLATFADGNAHYATITYDGVSTLSVYLDGSGTPIVSATVTGGLSTFLGLSGPAYVGFTAATGGAQENSDILTWTWN